MQHLRPTDIHEALSASQLAEPMTPQRSIVTSTRLPPSYKALAERICAQNATTLSAYIRSCVISLVVDYAGSTDLPRYLERMKNEASDGQSETDKNQKQQS